MGKAFVPWHDIIQAMGSTVANPAPIHPWPESLLPHLFLQCCTAVFFTLFWLSATYLELLQTSFFSLFFCASLRGWTITGTGSPRKRLWHQACESSRTIWIMLLVMRFILRWSCEQQGVGLCDPYGCLPTWDILCFSDSIVPVVKTYTLLYILTVLHIEEHL